MSLIFCFFNGEVRITLVFTVNMDYCSCFPGVDVEGALEGPYSRALFSTQLLQLPPVGSGALCALDSIFDFGAIYCFLVYIICFPASSLFPYLSPPLLTFSFENRPRPDVVKERLNLAVVLCVFILCCGTFLLIGECVLLSCWD